MSNIEYDLHNAFERKKIRSCLPAKRSNIKTPFCPSTGWSLIDESTGSGCSGSAFTACCGENCNYTAKYIQFNPKPPCWKTTASSFRREAEIQKACGEEKDAACIQVIDHWCDEDGGYIVMPTLHITLLNFLLNNLGKDKFLDVDISHRLVILRCILDVFFVMKRLHEQGIMHGDPHTSNLMATLIILNDEDEDAYVSYFKSKHKWYVIDMGKSEYIPKDDVDKTKIMEQMDFELLKGSIIFDIEQVNGQGVFDAIYHDEIINLLDPLFSILQNMLQNHDKDEIWQEILQSTSYGEENLLD